MELIIHFVVPFTALMLLGVKAKRALPISLLALLPDLDAFFFVHRSLTHSLVVVLGVAAPLLLLAHRFRPGLQGYVFMALFAVESHIFLDLFDGYTPLLWPLYGNFLWIHAELGIRVGGSAGLSPSVEMLVKPITFKPFQSLDAPLLTGGGLITSFVLLTPVLLKVLRAFWQRTRGGGRLS